LKLADGAIKAKSPNAPIGVAYKFDLVFKVFLPRDAICTALLCHGKLSVCPSVTSRYDDHIDWNTSKIISRLISVGSSISADSDIMSLGYSKGNSTKF